VLSRNVPRKKCTPIPPVGMIASVLAFNITGLIRSPLESSIWQYFPAFLMTNLQTPNSPQLGNGQVEATSK
jgi:hypothetical protein